MPKTVRYKRIFPQEYPGAARDSTCPVSVFFMSAVVDYPVSWFLEPACATFKKTRVRAFVGMDAMMLSPAPGGYERLSAIRKKANIRPCSRVEPTVNFQCCLVCQKLSAAGYRTAHALFRCLVTAARRAGIFSRSAPTGFRLHPGVSLQQGFQQGALRRARPEAALPLLEGRFRWLPIPGARDRVRQFCW